MLQRAQRPGSAHRLLASWSLTILLSCVSSSHCRLSKTPPPTQRTKVHGRRGVTASLSTSQIDKDFSLLSLIESVTTICKSQVPPALVAALSWKLGTGASPGGRAHALPRMCSQPDLLTCDLTTSGVVGNN